MFPEPRLFSELQRRKEPSAQARRVGRQVTGRSTAKVPSQHSLIYRHLRDTFDLDLEILVARLDLSALLGVALSTVLIKIEGKRRLKNRANAPSRSYFAVS